MDEATGISRQSAHEGGMVVSPTQRPTLPPRRYPCGKKTGLAKRSYWRFEIFVMWRHVGGRLVTDPSEIQLLFETSEKKPTRRHIVTSQKTNFRVSVGYNVIASLTCSAHAPYCHLCPAPIYIFPHYLINGTIFGKKLRNTKCVFWFSLQRLSETFLIPRRIERDMIKNVYRPSCKVPVIVVRF